MTRRKRPFINTEIYHVFNKLIFPVPEFFSNDHCNHFLELLRYYSSKESRIRFSYLKTLHANVYGRLLEEVADKNHFRIDILAFCLMPTHFHLLLRQRDDNGISRSIGTTINSFTRYFNIKHNRLGPLFLPVFKSVLIESVEQLIHVSRYIHLNPYSNGLVSRVRELRLYKWSSYSEYLYAGRNYVCETDTILSSFTMNRENYRVFVEKRANYQKTLEQLKIM